MKLFKSLIVSLLFVSCFVFAKVNINTATAAELTALKGIGEKKAQAIVSYRKNNGEFASVADLVKVNGIGEKTVAKLKMDLSVSGKTDLTNLKNSSTKPIKKSKTKKSTTKKSTTKKSTTKKSTTKKSTTKKSTTKKSTTKKPAEKS